MKISRRQLSLLIETYLKQPQLLFEIKKKAFSQFIQQGIISQQEFNMLVFNKDWVPPFNDPIMAQILFNTLKAGQNHSVNDVKAIGEDVINKIIDNARNVFNSDKEFEDAKADFLPARLVRGTSNEYIDILPMIDVQNPNNTTATYNDVVKYLENLPGIDKRGDHLTEVIRKGLSGDTTDFEVINDPTGRSGKNRVGQYFVAYPKTHKGSIALGKMGPDFRFYNPNKPDERAALGEMNWCTTVDGAGNMFLNYHRNMNLHMYYLTRLSNYYPHAGNRKFCLSFTKDKAGNITLHEDGHATVNGDNKPAGKDTIISEIGVRLYNIIENDVRNASRAVINPIKYLKSINLEQYQNMRAANQRGQDLDLFVSEAGEIAKHTENDQIIQDMIKDPDERIMRLGLNHINSVEGTKFALQHHSMDRIIRNNAPLTPEMVEELYRADKEKNNGRSSSFVLYHLLKRTYSLYGGFTPMAPISDQILDEIVDDILSDNFIYGRQEYGSNRAQQFEPGTIYRSVIQQPNLTTEHMYKIYDVFSGQRSANGKGDMITDLISLENCPKELFDKELTTKLTVTMKKNLPVYGNAQVNELGEPRDTVGVFARRLVSQADKDFLSKLTPQSAENLIQALADTRVDPMRTMLGNFDLNPIVAIKVFERALDMEADLNVMPSVSDRMAYGEKVESMAEHISIFVHPKKVNYLDEIYGDTFMEIDYPLSDMPGGRASEFNKVWNKVYGDIDDVGEYLSEIVAYMQEYEDEPEDDVKFYSDSILKLYKIISYVYEGKRAWQNYTQKTDLEFPYRFKDMLDF
jgi:hypothetical protein